MIKIAICDDEKYYREYIKKIVTRYMGELNIECVIDTFESGKNFSGLGIEMIQYEIVLLDINMDDMDGIKIAQSIREFSKNTFIVFITAYVSYALEGYKVDAVRYLLKGNDNFELSLMECIDTIIEKSNFKIVKKEFKFVEGKKMVSLDRILYIESKLHKLEFVIMENEIVRYSYYDRLDSVEELLRPFNFIRSHQSYLLNLKHICLTRNNKAILCNGIEIPISKANSKSVNDAFISYKGEI